MYIVELTYKASLENIEELLDDHRAFLDRYYKKGLFIASGPKNPREGGVLLAKGSIENIHVVMAEDPFIRNDLVEYRVIEFIPRKHAEGFEVFL